MRTTDTEFKEGCETDEFVFKEACEFAFLMLIFRFVRDLRLPWDLKKGIYNFPPSPVVLLTFAVVLVVFAVVLVLVLVVLASGCC